MSTITPKKLKENGDKDESERVVRRDAVAYLSVSHQL